MISIKHIALAALSSVALSACSTLVSANLSMDGMPKEQYKGESTVTTKYMARADVSKYCANKLQNTQKGPTWYNACVYKKRSGEIVMVMPAPGTIAPETYAKLLEHEYQHVGQAIRDEHLDHKDWQ